MLSEISNKLEKATTVKFDIAMTCSLAKLQDYTLNIADILGLRPFALRLLSIEEGCVVITLLIPAPVADVIFSSNKIFTTEERKQFQGLSILWLKCSGREYDFSELSDEHNGQNPMKESQSTNSGIYDNNYILIIILTSHMQQMGVGPTLFTRTSIIRSYPHTCTCQSRIPTYNCK